MSLAGTHTRNASEVPLNKATLASRIVKAALHTLIAPVRDDFDAVMAQLDAALTADIATADAVSTYVARTKGKGIRPALVLLSAASIAPVTDEIRLAAVGIELLQASTLLHDDVIDNSTLRRGRPSVNARWGNEVAVLMGDVLFIEALSQFVNTGSLDVMHAAARQTRLMIEGEVFARDLRHTPDFRESTYFDLIRHKTGALMSLATEIGPRLAGADPPQIEGMGRYGEYLGMAFQIVDDVLDVAGDESLVGKPTGQDLREGTITLPLIRALDTASNGDSDRIRTMVVAGISSDDQWDTVRRFITRHAGVNAALAAARTFSFKARAELSCLPPSSARDSLDQMLDYIIRRTI